jgi:serine/threonine protein kinase
MRFQRLELQIASDVAKSFARARQSTARRVLLIKFINQPTAQAIINLVNGCVIRVKGHNVFTTNEEYLPRAAAFELCDDAQLREEAKRAATIVLHTLQQMFIGEPKKEGYTFEDLDRHVSEIYPNQIFEDNQLKLGLYLVADLNVLSTFGYRQPGETELESFQIGEAVMNMPNIENQWDNAMAGFKQSMPSSPIVRTSLQQETAQWEHIRRIGGGGQSDVFLVRSPARVTQRAVCLQTIRTALDGDKRADLAEAIWAYSRSESLSELGAKKIFKIRSDGNEQQACQRLKLEFKVLEQKKLGLPRLLDSNESERWIVTEFFPHGTLEDNIEKYKANPALALKAFLSLVNTVTQLHDENIVHRDIKPANVFVKQIDELVLGDFGIVFLPDQPVRLTRTNESVGPHDYMPPWVDVGGRVDRVGSKFDVYMLGKLLWCMVSGRLVLQREWFQRPENDVTVMFKHDPHAHMINTILEKCVVEREQDCVGIHDLRAMIIAFVSLIEQGGQLLQPEVPRPCHVCGHGRYEPEDFGNGKDSIPVNMRFWNEQDIKLKKVQVFTCSSCGHVALFRIRR